MDVTVRLHGVLTRVCASDRVTFELDGGGASVGEVLAALATRFPPIEIHLSRVACAIGAEVVSREHCLPPGAELVLIPPVSGG